MQKNAPDHYPDDLIGRYEVARGGGGTTTYPVVRNTEGIAFFANLGVITFHVPPVTVEDPTHPDWIIWDLDPPEGHIDLAREAAHALGGFIDSLGISTWVMASGSKGYHLRTPLDRKADFATVANFARGTAALAVADHPHLMTLAFKKAERGDRVFVDWLRNAPLSTAVAPWSLRARKGAPVAVPLAWDEIDSMPPHGIGLRSVGERFDFDPWGDLEGIDFTDIADVVNAAIDDAGIRLEPFDRFRS
jgi:bifunctional non-homologous end joining protein LigD